MPKNTNLALIVMLIFALALAACQTESPTASTGPSINLTVIAPTLPSGYPAPGENIAAYPPPAQAQPTQPNKPLDQATQDPNRGSVVGVLQLLEGGSGRPVGGQTLYLARVIVGSDGQERAASFSQQTAPRAVTDDEGTFRFVNVPSGRYGLVMDIVIESYLLNDPTSGASLLMTVEDGQEVDLGELIFTSLPLPSE